MASEAANGLNLTSVQAQHIINALGSHGVPPMWGVELFSSGLEPSLNLLEQHYFKSFIKEGGSAFKMVVGIYGGGKTHFLYCVRERAWKHNFMVSYVSLSSQESPFHRLELVYKAVAKGIVPPLPPERRFRSEERGIGNFVRYWVGTRLSEYTAKGMDEFEAQRLIIEDLEKIHDVDSISFSRAIQAATKALIGGRDEDFQNVEQWLTGEGYQPLIHRKQHNILEKIDNRNAFSMIRSLCQWARHTGHSGLIILFDEAEQQSALSSRQHTQLLSNLREMIDTCTDMAFSGVMMFYAVPTDDFLDSKTGGYLALRQRVETIFDNYNAMGVRIPLEDLIPDTSAFLADVGAKVAAIHSIAYGGLRPKATEHAIATAIDEANVDKFSDIGAKRRFVQLLIKTLERLRLSGQGL